MTRRLKQAVSEYRSNVLGKLGNDERAFVVGHPDFRYTQIPARDGVGSGKIKRSAKPPNCSYFTNWIDVEDTITWDVEVPADGDFDVEVYYACPKQDVGSTIELHFGDSHVAGQISVPHDPPAVGAEDDRFPRKESYVKDFRPLNLGTIHLSKGQGTLALKARTMPGTQVMEFRLLMLTRRDAVGVEK